MSMSMEHVVTQLQQELFTLRAQRAAESGLADAVRAINNLVTAQVRSDTPSLIDVKGLGRPKEFSGEEEDVQRWSKKTEAFFAGVIKESEMMEWAAEQTTEVTAELIANSLPTATNQERGVQNLQCVLAADAYSACGVSRVMRRMTLLPTRGRTLWRHGGGCTGGRKRNLLRTIISPGTCSLLELQAGIERWDSYVSRYEKKLKDKMDDEIKLLGLKALVPEELEKHVTLNSNRLRTFEDARLEIVTYVEAKFGLRIRDSKSSDTGWRGLLRSCGCGSGQLLSSGKGKGSSSPRDGCFMCGGAHLERDCNAEKNTGKQSSGKGKQSKSWSKSEGKGKSKENKGKSKGQSKGAKGSCKGFASKMGTSGLES